MKQQIEIVRPQLITLSGLPAINPTAAKIAAGVAVGLTAFLVIRAMRKRGKK